MTNFKCHYDILQYFNGIYPISVVHTTTVLLDIINAIKPKVYTQTHIIQQS